MAADDYDSYCACALHDGYLRLQTHTLGVRNTAFAQQWLCERASALRYTYIACIV